MERADIYQQVFEQEDFTNKVLLTGDYEKCEFRHCNFSGTDLSKTFFIDCIFSGSDLSNVKLHDTAFRNVQFTGCKMLGLAFENCNRFLLEMNFEGCTLNHASFYQLALKKTSFNNSVMHEVGLTEADLRGSSFTNTDLSGAVFDQTNIEQADLRNALHFAIDPEINKIKKAKFSPDALAGLLTKYEIDISI